MQSPLSSLIFLVLLVALFYFMLLRPQRKRVEMHRRLMDSLDDGDEVVTIGGVFGTVESLGNDDVVLEVAPGTNIRVLKSAIARKLTEEPELEEGEDEEAEEAEEQ